MRILFLDYKFPLSGEEADNTLRSLLNEYAQKPDMHADVVALSEDGEGHAFKLGENINIYQLPIGKNPKAISFQSRLDVFKYAWNVYKFCKKLAKTNRYDLVHSFSVVPCSIVAYLLKRKFKIPYIISIESQDVEKNDKKTIALRKKLNRIIGRSWEEACFYVASSQKMAELMLKSKPEREINVIYDGIEAKDFFPDSAKKEAGKFTVLCVSDIVPEKGIRILIRAFNILVKRYAHMRLLIVGEGTEKTSLEDLVLSLSLKGKVSFAGSDSREKLLEYYQQADLFVQPSLDEDLNNENILRALACGLPVIVTKASMAGELIENEKNGFVIKTNDSHDLVEAMEKFLLDSDLSAKMGREAKETTEKNAWSLAAGEYLDLYGKTISLRKIKQGS